MKQFFFLLALITILPLAVFACGEGNDSSSDDDSTPPVDDDFIDDDDVDDDLADDDAIDDDANDDDSTDDDVIDDDTIDDDVVDDDTGDDDTTPYWEGGEDLGPVPMEVYRLQDDQGLNAWEWETGIAAKDAALASSSVMFIATLEVETGLYYLWHHDGELVFSRTIGDDGLEFEIVNQIGPDLFPSQDPTIAMGYDAEIAMLENPGGIQMTEHGYEEDDPRVGWIPDDQQSYPLAFERIAQLFDSPYGPDIAMGVFPSHGGGVGSHGNLGVMQSRATLLLSGAGIRPGILIDDAVKLVDLAPTALALLGAEPTEGIDRRGHYVTRSMLTWQDGRVLAEVLTNPALQGLSDQVVILLFDGLAPNELYFHYENQGGQGWDLPNFFELIENGAFYRGGAVVGWPSFTFPGHNTLGTGVYQGHHGFVANEVYDRITGDTITVTWYLDQIEEILADPVAALEAYLGFFHEERDVETLFQATHRSFGDWELERPITWGKAYTSSVNEMTFYDADYSPYVILEIASALLPELDKSDPYAIADVSVPLQIGAMLFDPTHQAPKITYASFYSTDHTGEQHGPHSDFLREELVEMDRYVGFILDFYRSHGLYDRTTFIITSDHGMELLQPGLFDPWTPYLNTAGIRYRSLPGNLLLLMVMRLLPSQSSFPAGVETTFSVTVANDDNEQPVEGAAVTLTGGTCQPCQETTGPDGVVWFTVTPTAGENLQLTADQDDFNQAAIALEVYQP